MSNNVNTASGKNERKNSRNKNSEKKDERLLPFGCSSRISVCIIICVICCAVVFAAARWDVLSPSGISEWFSGAGTSDDDFPVDIVGTTVLENNVNCVDGSLMYISDTSIVHLANDGTQLYNEQHNFISPQFKTSGTYSIAYNTGGNGFRIISEDENIYSGTQGTVINDCDIALNGVYCVISDQTGYLSILSVYDAANNLLYSYSFNDFYALSVSINDSGTMAAVGAANTVNGEMVTKVYILDFTKTEPLNTYTYNDQIVYSVEFCDDGKAAVVTDSLISVVETSKQKETAYSFDNRVITAYDILYGESIVLSLSRSDDGRDCTVVCLDANGNEVNTFATGLKISSVSLYDDRIALLSDSMLSIYNSYGDSFGEWEVGSDSRRVILSQTKTAYILGVSEFRRLSLKAAPHN